MPAVAIPEENVAAANRKITQLMRKHATEVATYRRQLAELRKLSLQHQQQVLAQRKQNDQLREQLRQMQPRTLEKATADAQRVKASSKHKQLQATLEVG